MIAVRTLFTPIEALKHANSDCRDRRERVRTLLTPIEALKRGIRYTADIPLGVRTLLTPIEALKQRNRHIQRHRLLRGSNPTYAD